MVPLLAAHEGFAALCTNEQVKSVALNPGTGRFSAVFAVDDWTMDVNPITVGTQGDVLEVVASPFTMIAGPYGGSGTAGWTGSSAAGRWKYKDTTSSSVVPSAVLTNLGPETGPTTVRVQFKLRNVDLSGLSGSVTETTTPQFTFELGTIGSGNAGCTSDLVNVAVPPENDPNDCQLSPYPHKISCRER